MFARRHRRSRRRSSADSRRRSPARPRPPRHQQSRHPQTVAGAPRTAAPQRRQHQSLGLPRRSSRSRRRPSRPARRRQRRPARDSPPARASGQQSPRRSARRTVARRPRACPGCRSLSQSRAPWRARGRLAALTPMAGRPGRCLVRPGRRSQPVGRQGRGQAHPVPGRVPVTTRSARQAPEWDRHPAVRGLASQARRDRPGRPVTRAAALRARQQAGPERQARPVVRGRRDRARWAGQDRADQAMAAGRAVRARVARGRARAACRHGRSGPAAALAVAAAPAPAARA